MKPAPALLPRNFNDNWTPKYFYILAVCLAVAMLTANIISFKIMQLFGIQFSGGTLLFPVCLIVGDLMTEVYGFRRSRGAIFLTLGCYFAYTFFTQLAIYMPAAPEWKNQDLFQGVFGQTPRFCVAGAAAYLTSELTNSYIMSRMKVINKGKYFSFRATASAIAAELVNTSVFMSIAWAGRMEPGFLAGAVLAGTVIKVSVQTIVLPVTSRLATKLKLLEGVDHFDGKT